MPGLWAHRPSKPIIDYLEMPTSMGGFLCLLLRLDVNKNRKFKSLHNVLADLFQIRIYLIFFFCISGMSFLLPFLYIGYIWQLYNAYTLYYLINA